MKRTRNAKTNRPIIPVPERSKTTVGVLLVLACLAMGCHSTLSRYPAYQPPELSTSNARRLAQAQTQLRNGDLVLRTGKDFISESLMRFSQTDPRYSHCGLVVNDQGRLEVYHAIGGEDNPDARLRRDSFSRFADPRFNSDIAIYRYDLPRASLLRLDSLCRLYYIRHIGFDMAFDLASNSRFYCTEFVYKVLIGATRDSSYLPVSHLGGFRYVAPDNLYLNAHAHLVWKAHFSP